MAHGRHNLCGCFPTGLAYPGVAELLLQAPVTMVGLAEEIEDGQKFLGLPLAVIDTETTGREPARGDRVIEVAVVHFDGGKVTARHALLVDPGMPIPKESTAVHGITDDDVRGKPKWDAVARDVMRLLAGRVPVAYNAGFDRAFIFAEMRRAGISPSNDKALPPALRNSVDWIDPLVWARATQPAARGFKLGEVAARLEVPLVQAHRATDDAEAAGLVLMALLKDNTLTYREVVQRQRLHANAFDAQRSHWRK